jgi:hypothetical protein
MAYISLIVPHLIYMALQMQIGQVVLVTTQCLTLVFDKFSEKKIAKKKNKNPKNAFLIYLHHF